LVSNWNPWYHDFFSSRAFAIPCDSCELARAFSVYIREIKYLICMSLQSAAPATEKHPVPLLDATLIQSVPLSPSAHHLTFRVENEDRLEFLPGQSIRIEVPVNGNSMQLPFSIASAPREDNCFELCLKRGSKGSPADRLCELNAGTQLRSSRPSGAFVLNEPTGDTVFLAAGTGIAPIRSMLHWLLQQRDRRHSSGVWLLFGARDNESLFFDQEFRQLAGQHSSFHYIPTLSRPYSSWNGARGYVQDHLHALSPSTSAVHAYLCGPEAMIISVRDLLQQSGWPEDLVHYERHD